MVVAVSMEKIDENFLTQLTGCQRRLLGYVQALVPNRADAEDLLQEVNLFICRHAADYRPGTDFIAWAFKVAYFRVLEWRERRSRDRLVFDDGMVDRLSALAELPDRAETSRRNALEQCLQKLAQPERELITRYYGDADATPQGLSESLGRSLKGLYVSVHRIRVKLFDCIQRTLAAEERT